MDYISNIIATINSIYMELVTTTTYNTACAVMLGTVLLFVTAATLTVAKVAKVIPALSKRVATIGHKTEEKRGGA